MSKRLLCALLLMLVLACGLASGGTVPQIVKRFCLKNQNGAIGPITIYTPKHQGLFRLSAFMVTTTSYKNGEGNVCPIFGFTDGDAGKGYVNLPNNCLVPDKGNVLEGVAVIGSKAEEPITLTTSLGDGGAGAHYNVRIIVEEF